MTELYQKWPKGLKNDDLKQESKPIKIFWCSEYILWSQRTEIKYNLHYWWCTGRLFTASKRHNTSCSEVKINLKRVPSRAEIRFKMRNMDHTSKFRLFKPHQWPWHGYQHKSIIPLTRSSRITLPPAYTVLITINMHSVLLVFQERQTPCQGCASMKSFYWGSYGISLRELDRHYH